MRTCSYCKSAAQSGILLCNNCGKSLGTLPESKGEPAVKFAQNADDASSAILVAIRIRRKQAEIVSNIIVGSVYAIGSMGVLFMVATRHGGLDNGYVYFLIVIFGIVIGTLKTRERLRSLYRRDENG